MKEPSNNIDEVLILVAKKFGMKGDEWREMAARTFVDKYRKVCIWVWSRMVMCGRGCM